MQELQTPNRRPFGRLLALLVFFGAASSAAPVLAQFDEYKPPGGVVQPPADRKGQLDKAADEARWHLGPVKIAPWWELRDIQYVDNAFGESGGGKEGDITASMGAGVRAYFHTGPKVYWVVRALPEYVWWQKTADRRRLGGRYGVGAFAFFNRLTVQATGERTAEQAFLSPEVAILARPKVTRGAVLLDLQVTDRISVFAGADEVALRTDVSLAAGEAPFDRFDRDETLVRAGARYSLPRGFSIGLGAERAIIDFVKSPGSVDRSSEGTSPFLQLRQQNDRRFFDIEIASRSADPRPGSSFVPFDSTTAKLTAGFDIGHRLTSFVYGSRGIVYTLASGYSYLKDDRIGGALEFKASSRTSARVFVETGRNDYQVATPGTPERRDDLLAYGASLDLVTGRASSLGLRFSRLDLTSDLPGFDRTVTTVGAGITFRGGETGW